MTSQNKWAKIRSRKQEDTACSLQSRQMKRSNNGNHNAFSSIILCLQRSFAYVYVSLSSYKISINALKFERGILQANRKETLLDTLRSTSINPVSLRELCRRKTQRPQTDFNFGPTLLCQQWRPDVLSSGNPRPCWASVVGNDLATSVMVQGGVMRACVL